MDKEKIDTTVDVDAASDDTYVAIKWEEYKELLMIKGKYEELKNKEAPIIQYIPYAPNIQPVSPVSIPDYLGPKVTFGEVSTATSLKKS